jgi:hypothetical protein
MPTNRSGAGKPTQLDGGKPHESPGRQEHAKPPARGFLFARRLGRDGLYPLGRRRRGEGGLHASSSYTSPYTVINVPKLHRLIAKFRALLLTGEPSEVQPELGLVGA